MCIINLQVKNYNFSRVLKIEWNTFFKWLIIHEKNQFDSPENFVFGWYDSLIL